jgi:16S rRNA (adenine1518-N6/adenine1519-N6)-dimethyltransferase
VATHKKLVLKKSLGQHYLHDEHYCKRISDAMLSFEGLKIVEVGPGAGAITKYFPEERDYLGIEFDQEKVDFLKKNYPRRQFLQHDILRYLIEEEILLCGNYPYNISGPILFKTLENKQHIPVMIGMFQKEVAQRIVAEPRTKAYGILSVLCQSFYDCERLFDIPPGAFQPPPKVMSSMLQMIRNENPYDIQDFNQYKILVKTAFNQRRKTLSNSLKSLSLELPEDIKKKRPEELTPKAFAELYHQLYS